MIQLYTKTGCPYCAKVLKVLAAYHVDFDEKNISIPENLEELMRLGGKKQEPFMVDGETMMYESDDIITYLENNYRGEGAQKRPKVHFAQGSEICPS